MAPTTPPSWHEITSSIPAGQAPDRSGESPAEPCDRPSGGHYRLDRQWRITALDPVAEQHFGRPAAELIGRTIGQATGTAPDAAIHRIFQRARASGRLQQVERQSRTRAGRWIAMDIFPCGDAVEVFFRDISARKQDEADVRRNEARFRKIFNHATLGIAITDWEGRFRQCNPAYCTLLGYSEAELHRIDFESLVHPQDREANRAEVERLKSGALSAFEIDNRYLHKEGHSVWVHKFVSTLPDDEGRPTHLMALVSDITPQKQAHEEVEALHHTLVEQNQLAERRAVYIQQLAMELTKAEDRERHRLAGVLHDDFQQSLAYLKLKLNTLGRGQPIGSGLPAINALIDGCIDQCRNLAHELKPFATQQKDFIAALNWVARQMREMYRLEVVVQAPTDPGIRSSVLMSLLIRSIKELLFNVVKHSGETRAWIDLRVDGRQMLITIRDAGNGCDAATLHEKRLNNDAFGLFTIEDRVNFLGGSMQIESEPGRGFRVTLWVPRDVHCPSDGPSPDRPAAPPAGTEERSDGRPAGSASDRTIRVLLADDHDLMRLGLARLLEEQERIAVVGMAADGRQAVALAARLQPDVVLMDVSMPVMSGIEATRRIVEASPGTRIVGLTMHKDPDIHQAMSAAGAQACLPKDGSPEELIAFIRQSG